MMSKGSVLLAVPVWALVACAAPVREVDAGESMGGTSGVPGELPTGAASVTAGESSGSTAKDTDDRDPEPPSGESAIYDVNSLSDVGVDPDGAVDGCTKLDFLFVVDNSLSMASYQGALVSSFGPFIQTIAAEVQASDYRVLVVDSDAGDDLLLCQTCLLCGDYCQQPGSADACEGVLGAGEVQPYGAGASNKVCGVPMGRRYITSGLGTQAMTDLFPCIAQVGTGGSGLELPMSAMVQAVTDESAAGGCNEGFVRDDAVLVVTVISDDPPRERDEDNASSVGSPQEWFDAVVGAKGGADNVVMLEIVVVDPEYAAPRFLEFAAMFGDRGLVGDIAAPGYGEFFEEAVAIIDFACDEFTPEG